MPHQMRSGHSFFIWKRSIKEKTRRKKEAKNAKYKLEST